MLIFNAFVAIVELLLGIFIITGMIVLLMYCAYLILHALYCLTNIPAIEHASDVVLDYTNSVVDDFIDSIERK